MSLRGFGLKAGHTTPRTFEPRIRGLVEDRPTLTTVADALLTRVKRWSSLKAWAMRIKKHSDAKKLARKLAVLSHRLWWDGTTFRWTSEATI